MDVIPGSSFDTLETCFRLLTSGPAPLTLDGRHVGHGLPARSIPLGELRVLLQHPAATSDLQRAALGELIHLATQQRDGWMVGLAGVLLPGLCQIAASVASVDHRAPKRHRSCETSPAARSLRISPGCSTACAISRGRRCATSPVGAIARWPWRFDANPGPCRPARCMPACTEPSNSWTPAHWSVHKATPPAGDDWAR